VNREELERLTRELEALREQNQRLRDRVTDPDYTDPGDATDAELRTRIQELQQALTELRDTIEHDPPETDVGQETLSASFPFDADLAPENVLVRMHYSNGTTRTLSTDSEHVRIDSSMVGQDEVVVENYPLPASDVALANVEVDVATEEGIGNAETRIRIPAFDGTVPKLDAVEVATLPGR
jgi:hypothetical protein